MPKYGPSNWLGEEYLGPDASPLATFRRLAAELSAIRDGSALKALEARERIARRRDQTKAGRGK
jgi:hypothetical protein